MKKFFLLLSAYLLLPSNIQFAQQVVTGSFEHDGLIRNYIVFLPQNYQPNMPAVFNLHGYTDNAQWQMDYSAMNSAADTMGFIVVYPDAIYPGFNSGIIPSPGWPAPSDADDVGFISKLIDVMHLDYQVDMNRVYSCGYSNGGHMTIRIACELGYRFAAAASVCGSMLNPIANNCNEANHIPIAIFNGTADSLVYYIGDPARGVWPIEDNVDFWVQKNNCVLTADTVTLPDIDTTDGCTVQKISYLNCEDSTRVVFYKIIEGGHSWPQGTFTGTWAGNTNKDISANEEILNFFNGFSNSIPDFAYSKSMEVSHKYFPPQGDTLKVTSVISIPENHQVAVYALINGPSFNDSIQLSDNGLGCDGNATDNTFSGAMWLSSLQEGYYAVELKTTDLTSGVINMYPYTSRFATTGPLKIDSIATSEISNFRYAIKPYIRNHGTDSTISNIRIELYSDDPCVTYIYPSFKLCPELMPGEVKTVSSAFAVTYDSATFPGNFNFRFEIQSNDILYWIENINVITGVEDDVPLPASFSLGQNYPNPFNPSTKIKYSVPHISKVQIKVFDVLGNDIETLVNEEKATGIYEINWHAENFPSGVYFYRLKAGTYTETKKMILLR